MSLSSIGVSPANEMVIARLAWCWVWAFGISQCFGFEVNLAHARTDFHVKNGLMSFFLKNSSGISSYFKFYIFQCITVN